MKNQIIALVNKEMPRTQNDLFWIGPFKSLFRFHSYIIFMLWGELFSPTEWKTVGIKSQMHWQMWSRCLPSTEATKITMLRLWLSPENNIYVPDAYLTHLSYRCWSLNWSVIRARERHWKGWALKISTFSGPNVTRFARCHVRIQKSLDFQGPRLPIALEKDLLPTKSLRPAAP